MLEQHPASCLCVVVLQPTSPAGWWSSLLLASWPATAAVTTWGHLQCGDWGRMNWYRMMPWAAAVLAVPLFLPGMRLVNMSEVVVLLECGWLRESRAPAHPISPCVWAQARPTVRVQMGFITYPFMQPPCPWPGPIVEKNNSVSEAELWLSLFLKALWVFPLPWTSGFHITVTSAHKLPQEF